METIYPPDIERVRLSWELFCIATTEPDMKYIERNICDARTCVDHYDGSTEDGLTSRLMLACWILTRCEQRTYENLDEAIKIFRSTISRFSTTASAPDMLVALGGLGKCLKWKYSRDAQVDDLEESLNYICKTLELVPSQDRDRHNLLHYFAEGTWRLFIHGKSTVPSLKIAADFAQESLQLRQHCQRKHKSLSVLGIIHFTLFEETSDRVHLANSISFERASLSLKPKGHPTRHNALNNLIQTLFTSYVTEAIVEDLHEAIQLAPEAVELFDGKPTQNLVLYNYTMALYERFKLTSITSDLEDSIRLCRKAVLLTGSGHPQHYVSLSGLSSGLIQRYQHYGELGDLEEAIIHLREILALCPMGNPAHGPTLTNLANALHLRFEATGETSDLSEAIKLHKDWLAKGNPNFNGQIKLLHHAARALLSRFTQQRNLHDVNHAIALVRDSVQGSGAYFRVTALHELATSLRTKFLACNTVDDLHEAMRTQLQAFELTPVHDSRRSEIQFGLAKLYLLPDTPYSNLIAAMSHTAQALSDSSSNAQHRLKDGVVVLHSMSILDGFKDITLRVQLLELHRIAITLLPRVALFGLELQSRLRVLRNSQNLALQAATLASDLHQPEEALELLEQGRAVFWSQSLRLRTQFTDLPSGLGISLHIASRQLEQLSSREETRASQNVPDTAQDEAAIERRRLADQFEALITEARRLPGFERFMLCDSYGSLTNVASRGPVVVLVCGLDRPTAIVIRTSGARAERLPLPKSSLRQLNLYAITLKTAQTNARNASRGRAMIQVRWRERKDETNDVLANLWNTVMRDIMEHLSDQLTAGNQRDRPRVWLCPTGVFTHLPLHAAGIYNGLVAESCSARAIFSYTPTLTALLKARARTTPIRVADAKVLLAAAPKPFKWTALPFAAEEVNIAKNTIPSSAIISFTDSSDSNSDYRRSSVQAEKVLEKLPEASIVHFACHGYHDAKNPLNSGFILNKMLSVSELMSLDLPHAFFACLSACETAKSDVTQPDEAIHLAATMLFAGFKSVIATMWPMGDADGPIVAKKVYEALFATNAEYLDPDAIPRALDSAVSELRTQGLHVNRWSPYVHIGV